MASCAATRVPIRRPISFLPRKFRGP
jgi:hypothetical protein